MPQIVKDAGLARPTSGGSTELLSDVLEASTVGVQGEL
jgi:hypothetical protein